MGKDIIHPEPKAQCSHSDRKDLPVCWDCAEEGHIKQKSGGEAAVSPKWENFRKIKKSLRFQQSSNSFLIGNQSSAPEVHPPEEGIEVGSPDVRKSQPGLEVVSGPQIVDPEDKFRKVVAVKDAEASDEKSVASSRDGGKIYRLKRRTFWVAVACALLILMAVTLGVAVGVTQRNRATQSTQLSMSSSGDQVSSFSSSPSIPSITTETLSMYMTSDSPTMPTSLGSEGSSLGGGETSISTEEDIPTPLIPATEPEPTADPTPSQPPTTATPSPAPVATTNSPIPSTSPSNSDPNERSCLGDDGSTYRDPGTGAQFTIECNLAHEGKDIENLEAESMEECVSLCAKDDQCQGAIWYNAGPQGTDLNYCWLKSAMDDERRTTRDAQSVVRI
ncbi:hypothetical protein F5X99DRAFT_424072 [Biscogniauxia marginata]|nr:hypothetical protein F5X99DRAFT_424072 [Biscogniauxia marginata]